MWSGDLYVAVKWEGMDKLYLQCIQQYTDYDKSIGLLIGTTPNNAEGTNEFKVVWGHEQKLKKLTCSSNNFF